MRRRVAGDRAEHVAPPPARPRRPLRPGSRRGSDLGVTRGQDRPQGSAVVRPARRRLLPRAPPRPARPRRPAREHPVLEDPDRVDRPRTTFRVGLIYGPSGCGKSSLVKAGLLPRLAKEVLSVYVEATPEETETRLLRGPAQGVPRPGPELRPGRCPGRAAAGADAPAGPESAAGPRPVRAVALARRGEENTELVAALRQCDGEHVQAIVMVRDDFWLAASRFMRDLEIDLDRRRNRRWSISSTCGTPARS